tara:strand:+ start:404 stop:805 length:402 start_codon:yes stop_codon:yes gene_type:complete
MIHRWVNKILKNKKMELKYFTLDEFDSPDVPGSGNFMKEDFLIALDKARDIAGIPFKINSGYRTIEHNATVGGVENSSHIAGLAADVHCTDSRERFVMIAAFIAAGFTRIGVAKTFIHVDLDKDKSQRVAWMY